MTLKHMTLKHMTLKHTTLKHTMWSDPSKRTAHIIAHHPARDKRLGLSPPVC